MDFRQVPNIARAWQQQARRVQAVIDEPYYIAFVYLPKPNKRFWHSATLEATGAQHYLSFHEDGSIWENKQLGGKAMDEQQ